MCATAWAPSTSTRNPAGVRAADDLENRVDGAERIRHVRDGNDARAIVQQLFVPIHTQLAEIGDRDDAQPRALLVAEHLPRDDVRVVLHLGHDDLVTGPTCVRP